VSETPAHMVYILCFLILFQSKYRADHTVLNESTYDKTTQSCFSLSFSKISYDVLLLTYVENKSGRKMYNDLMRQATGHNRSGGNYFVSEDL